MARVSVIEAGRPALGRRSLLRSLRGGLQGSEYRLGDRLLHPLCRGVPRLCRLSRRVRVVAGAQAEPLRRAVRRPDLPGDGGQHDPLPGRSAST